MEYTDEQITRILNAHKKKLEYDRGRYHKLKDNEEFKEKIKLHCKKKYERHREKIIEKSLEYYHENKEIISLKNSYRYYNKINNLEKFNTKYPDGLKQLQEINYIPESTQQVPNCNTL